MILQNFKQKTLAVLLFAAFSQSAYAADNAICDSTDTLKGFGAWCGIESFLSQQEPTAAGGPLFGSRDGILSPSFDSDKFGGQPQTGDTDNYNWSGYALFYDLEQRAGVLAKLEMNVDEANSDVLGVKATLKNGEVITVSTQDFYKQSFSYRGIPVKATSNINQENQSRYVFAGVTDRLSLGRYTYNEDGDYIGLVGIADLQPDEYQGLSRQSPYNQLLERISSIGVGVAGSPTPIVDMANLKSIKAYAAYNLIGVASVSGDINAVGGFMTDVHVDFNHGTWDMTNVDFYGLESGYQYAPISANGSISGNTFTSESISLMGNENYIKAGSYIDGKFLGPEAKGLTGEADITTNSLQTPTVSETPTMIPSVNIKATFVGGKNAQKVLKPTPGPNYENF
ncbi:hypothetical protein [Thiomicrorhabdus sp. Milos-T2]|uniref:hypothetical protein n=1 Tax=Thiomicrorhabdus sp. Milos-T2 TaxID=90814 RepID=UPI000494CDE0|nr:hypothetical protein [Thiomicrorhabdus sp. Milos-T2]